MGRLFKKDTDSRKLTLRWADGFKRGSVPIDNENKNIVKANESEKYIIVREPRSRLLGGDRYRKFEFTYDEDYYRFMGHFRPLYELKEERTNERGSLDEMKNGDDESALQIKRR